jgi:hypothetical protein
VSEGEGKRHERSKVRWPPAGSRGGGGVAPQVHREEVGSGRRGSDRRAGEEGHHQLLDLVEEEEAPWGLEGRHISGGRGRPTADKVRSKRVPGAEVEEEPG